MNLGENPFLKKSRSAQNLAGTRSDGSLANMFSATRQINMSAGLLLRSPFSKLNNPNPLAQTGAKCANPHHELRLNNIAHQSSELSEDRPGYVSVGDSRLPRAFRSRHPDNNATGPQTTQTQDFDNEGSRLSTNSRDPSFQPELSLKREHDGFSSPGPNFLLHNKNDNGSANRLHTASRFSSVASGHQTSPMTYQANCPLVKALSPFSQNNTIQRSPVGRQGSCSSTPQEATDDLSALMFKGATDLRNAKVALERKTEEAERLKHELQTITAERNGLLQRVNDIKQKTKEGLDTNARRLAEIGSVMETLKSRSRDYFDIVDEIRTSFTEIEGLKAMTNDASERVGSLLGDDGSFMPSQEWKAILTEIRQEITNKQQVIDLLRDKLEFLQGEHADAKSRAVNLEKMQAEGVRTLRATSDKLMDAQGRAVELAAGLKQQQEVNTDILVKNTELESIIKTQEAEKSDLRQSIVSKDEKILEIELLRTECLQLRSLVEERDKQLIDLQQLKEKLALQLNANEELIKTISTNEILLKDSRDTLTSTRNSLIQAETRLGEQSSRVCSLEKELSEARQQASTEIAQRVKIGTEKDALLQQANDLQSRLENNSKELEEYRLRVRQSETKYEMLQDKFDEQILMLRMEKKAHGDVQERIITLEAVHVRNLEEYKREYEVKIARLQEQNNALENKAREREAAIGVKQQESSARIAQLQEEHSKEMCELTERLDLLTRDCDSSQRDLEEAKSEIQVLYMKIQTLQMEASGLHKELLEARMPSEAHIQEVANLKAQFATVQREKDELAFRGKTLISRYESGDLSLEEKLLIDTIHRTSQSAHEQQLVAKGNEIRQRDNALRALEKRKCDLESQLARLLNVQAKGKTETSFAVPTRSLIDPDSWMSSQISSSPLRNKAQAPDRDDPTTLVEIDNIETTMTVDPRVLQSSMHNDLNQPPSMDFTPPIKNATVGKHAKSPNVTSFARLTQSADDSDEIRDFDDVARQDTIVPSSKRKRENQNVDTQETGKSRPLRRSRTVNRNQSAAPPTQAMETSVKSTTTVVKVKARKRR